MARLGRTDPSNTTAAESIILMDQNLNDLTNPFPNSVKINSLGYALNRLLIPNEAFKKRIDKVVIRLNKKLEKFSGQVPD